MEEFVKRQILGRQETGYATRSDFCRIFAEDMKNLYLLSLLLTADAQKAEQCFVSGFGDCSGQNHVFKEWARSWARRTIIQNAIRLVAPTVAEADGAEKRADFASDEAGPAIRAELSAVLALRPLERVTFVVSVLEGYSDQQCALLLGCTRKDMIAARSRAMQQIAQSADVGRLRRAADASGGAASPDQRRSILEMGPTASLAASA
jgi:DNA-directed RNA polymerase specialized sigma24 family protein